MQTLREKLGAGRTIVGAMMTWLTEEALLPVLQKAGYDFVIIDCEHGAYSFEQLANLCRLGRAIGFPVMVRCHRSFETIRRHMDQGPVGLLSPVFEKPEDLNILRDAMFLPPVGRRGPGAAGRECVQAMNRSDWAAFERELIILPQIESRAGIEALPKLLEPDWVTGAFMGPYDLMMDLGLTTAEAAKPGSALHAAVHRVIAICREAGKPAGMHTLDGDEAAYWIKAGCRIIICAQVINMVALQAKKNMETIRAVTG